MISQFIKATYNYTNCIKQFLLAGILDTYHHHLYLKGAFQVNLYNSRVSHFL